MVDDAIVVLENVFRHMEMGKKPFQAAIDGAREIVFTVVSMTTSLAIVFVPIMFMAGIYGRVLHEFAVTITIAILVSGFVALTVTPMLASRLLRPTSKIAESDIIFSTMIKIYKSTINIAVHHRIGTLVLAGAILGSAIYFFILLPKGFVPPVDMNYLIGFCIADQGISPDGMERKLQELAPRLEQNKEIRSVLTVSGYPQRNQGFSIAFLHERPPRKLTAQQAMNELCQWNASGCLHLILCRLS